MDKRLTFIGGGNMGRAIVGGLIAQGYDADLVRVADPSVETRAALARDFGIFVTPDNVEALAGSEIVVLAVKPQIMKDVAQGIARVVARSAPLVLSVAAGIGTRHLAAWLGGATPIVRVMPNTPALIGSGAAALYAGPAVTPDLRRAAQTIMESVGLAIWVDEEAHMDAVTALSGSGPAYFFLVLELLEAAAVELGLPQDTARQLAVETAYGAASLARESGADPKILRQQVTSPGGTTERALKELHDGGLADLINAALGAASRRSVELADEFGTTG
jgi:pyrroline-5-carboxylate reductase